MGRPSQIVKSVYKEHINRFGEPNNSVRFGDGEPVKGEEHLPSFVDVFIWKSDEEVDINTFSTIGMSDKDMNGADFRSELHFSVRGHLTDAEITKINTFLANISVYPFIQDTHFDWFQLLSNPGQIPCFDKATSILFHPAFIENGWDTIENEEKLVKILNVVPITEDERQIMKDKGFSALAEHFEKNNIDLFQRR
jgi:hypothetical protein